MHPSYCFRTGDRFTSGVAARHRRQTSRPICLHAARSTILARSPTPGGVDCTTPPTGPPGSGISQNWHGGGFDKSLLLCSGQRPVTMEVPVAYRWANQR